MCQIPVAGGHSREMCRQDMERWFGLEMPECLSVKVAVETMRGSYLGSQEGCVEDSADQQAPRGLTLFFLPPAVSCQKWLQAYPQQPAPSVPSCATQLPIWPLVCHLCPEHCPWQQWGHHPGSTFECPGPQGQPSSQPQLGHSCPLRSSCGPTGLQWAQCRPASAPQRAAWWGRKWRQQQQ